MSVKTRIEGKAGVITIDRPDQQNRLDDATLEALLGAFADLQQREPVRVVVLAGNDDYFCAGGQIEAGKGAADYIAGARRYAALHEQMNRCRAPIIAAVSGHCFAGGMSLLDSCDLAIAADDVQFGYPEINAGAFPLMAMATARSKLPPKRAFELFYSGQSISAAEARTLHVINEALPRTNLWPRVHSLVSDLASKNAAALRLGRVTWHDLSALDLHSAFEHAQAALVAMQELRNAER